MNYPCLGESLRDKAQIQEVLGKLLNEQRFVAKAIGYCFHVTVGNTLRVFFRSNIDNCRAHIVGSPVTADLLENDLHEKRFANAFHLRMAGQNALSQRRAAARQTNDENRRLFGRAGFQIICAIS